jgi:hypothetical protein
MTLRDGLPGRLAALLLILATVGLASCNGGGNSSNGSTPTPPVTLENSMAVIVDGGPAAVVAADGPIPNILYATVTVCVPGSTTNCQTIDHIQIDTQSVGLRLLRAVLNDTFASALKSTVDASTGNPVLECIPFADGYSWGPVSTVDLSLSTTEKASALPMHLIEDPQTYNIPDVPSDCVNQAGQPVPENTPAAFGANGILGVGTLLQDCGSFCAIHVLPASYYECTGNFTNGACTGTTISVAAQIQNPVGVLAGSDNNGVLIQLPAVTAPGAVTVAGTMYLGVGTQTNNHLPSASSVLPVDTTFGQFVAVTYGGTTVTGGAFDAGSSAFFFTAANRTLIPVCRQAGYSDFYCPTSTQMVATTVQGEVNPDGPGIGTPVNVNFNVDNAFSLFNSAASASDLALPTLAGTNGPGSFVYGLPYFYGRSMSVVFETRSSPDVPSQTGPYMTITN